MSPEEIKTALQARAPRRIESPDAREASVALILAPGPEGPEALFIRRAERPKDPWSGQIGLPGGRRDAADADRLATALRETEEETGIRLGPDRLLGTLDDLLPDWRGLPHIAIRPFVFWLEEKPGTTASPEVTEVFWAGLRGLRGSAGEAEVSERGRSFRVPALRAGERVIWGITRRILVPLLELV